MEKCENLCGQNASATRSVIDGVGDTYEMAICEKCNTEWASRNADEIVSAFCFACDDFTVGFWSDSDEEYFCQTCDSKITQFTIWS